MKSEAMNDNTTPAPRTAWAKIKTVIYVCWMTFGAVWIITHPTFLEPAKGLIRIIIVAVLLFVAGVFFVELIGDVKSWISRRSPAVDTRVVGGDR